MKRVVVSGGFDGLRSHHIRFLEEASKLGILHVLLWSDDVHRVLTGKDTKFPQAERRYMVEAIRYVQMVIPVEDASDAGTLPLLDEIKPDLWVSFEAGDAGARRAYCRLRGMEYRVLTPGDYAGFPAPEAARSSPGSKKVIVTGCYDWFHSGHVRFFEEASGLGDLYVVVGSDANVRLLKGPGHPLFGQDERRYIAGSMRYVKQCLISTGTGWMDAEPEVRKIHPDIYAVGDDGDRPEKREFCLRNGIAYVILERTPKEGLARRTSTELRGF